MADNVSIKSVKSDASGKTSISSNSRPSTQKSQTSKVKRRRRKSSVSSVGNGAKPKKDGGGIFEQTAIPEEKLPLELCGACQREARHVEATHFCEECSENLCATCVQQHRKFPLMKDHVIKPRGGATAVKTVAITTCEKHDGKALDMYCFDHDVVNCAACIAINHRKCKKVTYLPVAAKDIAQTEEYKDVIVTMETLRVELSTSRVRRNEDNIRLSKEKDDAVHRVKYIRKQINKCLDKLEEKTLEVLQNQFREYNARIQHDIDTCNEIIATLGRITSELSPATVMDDSQRFITMRQGKSTALKAKNTIATLHEMKGTEQIQFLPDPRITDLVKSLPSLGSFASEQRLLTATLVAQFDVHLANDVSECQILGSAFLPDGKAIIADWENKKVKLLNQSFKVLDHLKLSGCPYSVCCVNQNEGLVSMTNKKSIQVFEIDDRHKMRVVRSIKTKDFCKDVAYFNGNVYVVCGASREGSDNQLTIYTLDGTFIRSIVTDANGDVLFQRPLYVSLNSIGNVIVTDEDKGVMSMDDTGKVISHYSDATLKYPNGVVVVNNDQVLVCGFGSHNIVQLGRNFVLLGEIVSEADGLRNPKSVCYDVNSQRILVTCKNTNFIRIYSLK